MTRSQLFAKLQTAFEEILEEHHLMDASVTIRARGLSPEEAIGCPERKDFPILTGKETMLMAEFRGSKGQAFTDAPAQFSGPLQDILHMDLEQNPHARGLFIASLNAVMHHLGLSENAVHCRNDGPEFCAKCMVEWVREQFGAPRIALVGFQPALIGGLSKAFQVQVLDLNPDNIGKVKDGCPVRDGVKDQKAVLDWADLVLCTGSTLCNGTLVDFMDLDKPVVFFGTTLSGAAPLLGLRRTCFADRAFQRENEA